MRKKQEKKRWNGLAALLVGAALLTGLGGAMTGPHQSAAACGASASRHYLVPVGRTVGIKLFSHGVLVVGFSEVEGAAGAVSPAEECGLKVGDIITEIGDEYVNSIEEVTDALQTIGDEAVTICALRDGKRLSLTADAVPCLSDGTYRLGVWVRDSMAGIGTVTYYEPETGTFAALGHGITDVDTDTLMPLRSGSIMPSTVTGVVKGAQGAPGQLHGSFDLEQDLGSLTANTDCGVFGTVAGDGFAGAALPVAARSEVSTGRATILSNISGDEVREYEVEILRVYPESLSATRNLMIRVVDSALLEETGGIVQGMSGSPILQNGMLVGAVTHVLVNDPTCGYGILAETMLEAAG
ncbi:MAG: SpoIVB peptidase [Clostridiales bacterium]|nr:SpoIVB peptidase [Clostridiales bacterium]MCC8098957.1 SpoIVB peptidase [Clostridiales bacterium]